MEIDSRTEAKLPEIFASLLQDPEAPRFVHALLDAAAWLAGPQAEQLPEERAKIAAELIDMARLEREFRELRGATETRWDGRSSAFFQADALAGDARAAWLLSFNRLATLMDEIRAKGRGRS
jgi:hypothetical protein